VKKIIQLLAIGVAMIACSNSSLLAQTHSDTLADVTISSNRIQTKALRVAQSIGIISKKDMAWLPGKVAAEWLSTESGVDIRQRGPVGVQADIGIRGGSFDQTLVLLNGMKLSDPQTGHHMFNLPFTSEAIHQIEVVKTSASRLYGINALTGAVNFVTKVPDSNMVYLGAFGGDFGLYGVHAGAAVHTKKVGQHISFSQMHSDGYTSNTDFTTQQLFYQNTIATKKGTVNLTGGYTNRDFGARGFYVANSSEYESIQTAFGGVQYDVRFNRLRIKAQAYYRYNEDKYIFLRSNPNFFKNKHFSDVMGGEVHASYQWFLGETGVGVEVRNENLNSNNLGKRNRTINGVFAEHKFKFINEKLLITPGVYLNQYTGNSNLQAFPGIDIGYAATSSVLLYASADKGMRLPTYTDYYYQSPTIDGNPLLKPEQAVSTELGVKFSKRKYTATVAAFNRSSNNLIDWARMNDTEKWKPLNVNHVNFKGIEANLKVVFNTILNQISVAYTYIDADIEETENYLSRYTLTNIKHQAVGQVRLKWTKNMMHNISVRHVNRLTLADYTLVDTKLAYTFKNFLVYTEVMNVFDVNYTEAGFVAMPGRWFKLGVDFKLNFKRF
jgi:vitamin B12 transporter